VAILKYILLRNLTIISVVATLLYGFFSGAIGDIKVIIKYLGQFPINNRIIPFYGLIIITIILCILSIVQWRKKQRVKHQVEGLHQSPYKKATD